MELDDVVFGHLSRHPLVGSPVDFPLDGDLGADVGPAGEMISPTWVRNVWGTSTKSYDWG